MTSELKQWAEKRWAVVGFTHERAKEIIRDIESSCGKEIHRKIESKYELMTEFTDGTVLRHIRASENSRGHRFGKLWCDKSVNRDILNCVILPMYFGEQDDIIWL